jgi:hypothetical protein
VPDTDDGAQIFFRIVARVAAEQLVMDLKVHCSTGLARPISSFLDLSTLLRSEANKSCVITSGIRGSALTSGVVGADD